MGTTDTPIPAGNLSLTQFGIAPVAAEGGKLLWYHKPSRRYSDVVIPTPVCHEKYVYASPGDGCAMIPVVKNDQGKFEVREVYTNRYMGNRSVDS